MNDHEITFRIVKRIGVLQTYDVGWSKELNIVSWNGSTPKYDIRDWSPDHERMTKGITMFEDEARNAAKILAEHFAKMDEKVSSTPVV